jgi:hypothetical protein
MAQASTSHVNATALPLVLAWKDALRLDDAQPCDGVHTVTATSQARVPYKGEKGSTAAWGAEGDRRATVGPEPGQPVDAPWAAALIALPPPAALRGFGGGWRLHVCEQKADCRPEASERLTLRASRQEGETARGAVQGRIGRARPRGARGRPCVVAGGRARATMEPGRFRATQPGRQLQARRATPTGHRCWLTGVVRRMDHAGEGCLEGHSLHRQQG